MVVLRLGELDNRERKFIPTKKEYLEEYLNGLVKVEEYVLTQTFNDGCKYREYNDNGVCKYTKNKKRGIITEVEEITREEFYDVLNINGKYIKKIRKYYLDGDYEVDVDYFIEPVNMVMIEVASNVSALDEYVPPKGFVDVTGIEIYDNSNIYNGSIERTDLIIEGTDGVGKTSTIIELLKRGIISQDRCMDMISKNMLFTIPMEVRAKMYQDYLKEINKKIIILVNNDKEELERRINMRPILSEFDIDAYIYNNLYLETFEFMRENNMLENKMFMLDVTGLSVDEQNDKVYKLIKKI